MSAIAFEYTADAYLREGQLSAAQVKVAADGALAASPDAEAVISIARSMKQVANKAEEPTMYVEYIEPALAAASQAPADDEYAQSAKQALEIDKALFVDKNKDKAVSLKRASYEEGWRDDAGKLNGFAWWCFENKVNLEEAEVLARRGVEVAAAGTEKANLLDTAAEICNARGNCDDAVELIRQAMEEDPDREYFKKQLKRFEELRAQSM
jgi:hypothetical protein